MAIPLASVSSPTGPPHALAAAVALVALVGCTGTEPNETAAPAASSSAAQSPVGNVCTNAEVGYTLTYPAEWFVHPPNDQRDVSPCAHFGPDPFRLATDEDGRQVGHSVWIREVDACVEDEFPPALSREAAIDGFPARAVEYNQPNFRAYMYVVNLRPAVEPCEAGLSRFVIVRTDGRAAGNYEENKGAVDQIAMSLDLFEQ